MKKIIIGIMSVILAVMCIIPSTAACATVPAAVSAGRPDAPYIMSDALYAHSVSDSTESQSWQVWQNADSYRGFDEDDMAELGLTPGGGVSKEKYFFLPSSVKNNTVDIMNTFSETAVIGDTSIASGETKSVSFTPGETVSVTVGSKTEKLIFMLSTAETAVFANNIDADGAGTELYQYLSADKNNSATAAGAIVNRDGSFDNTGIKKIKGRGNTTWNKNKKPLNITYDSAVSAGGMEATKKFSLLANYQDASLSRNRFLYDLADAVGVPYASDSRVADLYINGVYIGSYQLCQKVDTGKSNLVSDVSSSGHLAADGSLNPDFSFIVEIDAGASDEDYYTTSGTARCNLTVKAPELVDGDAYYDDVLDYVRIKFDAMYTAVRTNSSNMAELIDIDSMTKVLLINELSKNWDVGISSLYFVYKPDADGNYKFFASPVWDYDNSLGNATGVKSDLRNMNVTDYEEYTGWWVKFKPGLGRTSKTSQYTIMGYAARNATIMKNAAQIWFNSFVPALAVFNSQNVTTGEIYSSDAYYETTSGSAEMNYALGWQLNTGDWICDHSVLTPAVYDSATGKVLIANTENHYDLDTFKGEYDYTVDWMNYRAAWLSAQYYPDYDAPPVEVKDALLGDATLDNSINIKDATLIQRHCAMIVTLEGAAAAAADANGDANISVQDATVIQKHTAGIVTGYPIGQKLG